MNFTSWKQKVGLAVFGVFLAFVILELILRLGGFLFFLKQEWGNRGSAVPGQEYRILCLGESTTALGGVHSYPRQLESILNQRQSAVRVKVINKGIPATTTIQITQNLPMYIKQYKPDMVVVMMGINDALEYISPKEKLTAQWKEFFYGMRTAKLLRLIAAHLGKKGDAPAASPPPDIWKEMENNLEPTLPNLVLLATLYRAAFMPEQEIRTLQRALALAPDNAVILAAVGDHYKRLGDYPQAIEYYTKSIAVSPNVSPHNLFRYANLAEAYKLQGNFAAAEEAYKKAILRRPDHPGAYGGLGDLYLEHGRLSEAKALFEKQIDINPQAALIYGKLAYCYRQEKQKDRAKKILLEGIKNNPEEISLYTDLAYDLTDDGHQDTAENIIAQAAKFDLRDDKGVVLEWAQYCKTRGVAINDPELRAWLESKTGARAQVTIENYKRLRESLKAQKIKMVAVQYPMRDVGSLRSILEDSADIVFVDNERSFKDAVHREGYGAYFSDRFAGDFGHCTVKGNALLAENIAEAVLPILP